MVAQVNEQEAAVVADAMTPAGKPDVGSPFLARVKAPQVCVR